MDSSPSPGTPTGRIQVTPLGLHKAVFSTLDFTYPLKLMVPRVPSEVPKVLACYILSYGGGLVCGDEISLDVGVGDGTGLVLLTQGSTKVFKMRPGRSPHSRLLTVPTPRPSRPITTQTMSVAISSGSSLYLLPAPVTCFSSARYLQHQTFRLTPTSNLILLDWYTSGRMSMGEEWQFEVYKSVNEVYIGEKRVVKDVMLLEDENPHTSSDSFDRGNRATTYSKRVKPYSCYATLFIFGPSLQFLLAAVQTSFNSISQYKLSKFPELVWSFSALENGKGGVVRCAGLETEKVKNWIRDEVLTRDRMEPLMGTDLWKNAFT